MRDIGTLTVVRAVDQSGWVGGRPLLSDTFTVHERWIVRKIMKISVNLSPLNRDQD